MKCFHVSKVTTKGQIVISKALRETHGMRPGTKVMLVAGKNEIRVLALNRAYLERFAGLLDRDGIALNELLRSRRDSERHVWMYRTR